MFVNRETNRGGLLEQLPESSPGQLASSAAANPATDAAALHGVEVA